MTAAVTMSVAVPAHGLIDGRLMMIRSLCQLWRSSRHSRMGSCTPTRETQADPEAVAPAVVAPAAVMATSQSRCGQERAGCRRWTGLQLCLLARGTQHSRSSRGRIRMV